MFCPLKPSGSMPAGRYFDNYYWGDEYDPSLANETTIPIPVKLFSWAISSQPVGLS